MHYCKGAVAVRNKTMKSKTLESIGRNMPPLTHHADKSKPFDDSQSEVLKWLSKQPEALNYVFGRLSGGGVIQYDSTSNQWVGVDWEDPSER